ncbi:MAG: MBL fold metallo-hydrolase [Albidovulum sp.]|nr:MBL fold metallo-hydrolase [Albidovulum sp.]
MSIVHCCAVGNGDMLSIRHNSENCTIIDCSISDNDENWILGEIDKQRDGKDITRFISTHPDQDHLMGLAALDDHIEILNFYVVNNKATKEDESDDFKRYKKLRDGDKAFYIFEGCKRRWINQFDEWRSSAGINIRWPVTSNKYFNEALEQAADGKSPNNISPVITYSCQNGVTMAWFGDLETDFMDIVKQAITWPSVDIPFAPHHGRDSGRNPRPILQDMDPKVVVIGEAPSKNLNYYGNYNTITQNKAGSI